MTFKEFISDWKSVVGVIGLITSTIGYLSSPLERYNAYREEQDSIMVNRYISKYVQQFTTEVYHLDSLIGEVKAERDSAKARYSASKSIGLRAYNNGKFEYRDWKGNTHEAYKTIVENIDGTNSEIFKYIDRETGIQHFMEEKYYWR